MYWTRDAPIDGDVALVLSSLVDYRHETAWAEAVAALKPGGTLRFRYRVIIHPGDSVSANIAELYKKYKEGK